MKNIFLTVILCYILSFSFGQSATDSAFNTQLQTIRQQVADIDGNPLISNTPLAGSLMWGAFNGNCIYILETKTLLKLECYFDDSTAGKKTFYYKDDKLIKVVDKEITYYYIHYLRDKEGNPINRSIERDLLFFSDQIKKLAIQLL